MTGMCPHCGELFERGRRKTVPVHASLLGDGPGYVRCEGSQQTWRNPESDARPLWNGKPNPHYGKREQ